MGNNILGRNCLRAEKLCFQVRKDTFGHVCKLFRRKDLVSKLLGFLLPAYYFRDFEVRLRFLMTISPSVQATV